MALPKVTQLLRRDAPAAVSWKPLHTRSPPARKLTAKVLIMFRKTLAGVSSTPCNPQRLRSKNEYCLAMLAIARAEPSSGSRPTIIPRAASSVRKASARLVSGSATAPGVKKSTPSSDSATHSVLFTTTSTEGFLHHRVEDLADDELVLG